tara:strand:+ start:367 stop:1023 length:657 start_codon:yes stop_codon:yes gene_type:complete
MKKYKKAIVLGGSKGIGKSISTFLKKSCKKVIICSRKEVDTSNLISVKKFLKKEKSTDIIILNSGGPPPLSLEKIDEKLWYKYFNQLFLSYFLILKNIKINKNGYVFYISSSIIKEPGPNLILSSTLRTAFSSFLKSYSVLSAKRKVSCINIAPGPTKTSRVKNLVKDIKKYKKNLPLGDLCDPDEIGKFVNFVVENELKYLTGSVVFFDGNLLKNFL